MLFVQSCAQKFSGLEERTGPARDFDRAASSRVPPRVRLAMPDREGTEATYLDPTAPRKCVANRREEGFNNAFDVAVLEMWVQLCHPSTNSDFVMTVPRPAGGASIVPTDVGE